MNRKTGLLMVLVILASIGLFGSTIRYENVNAKSNYPEHNTLRKENYRPRPKQGTILAGAYVYCTNSGSIVKRSFNNFNKNPITISDGSSLGVCTIDFGFDVSERFIIATVTHPTTPLGVTVSAPPFSGSMVKLFVWHAGNIAPVAGGDIFIIVY